MSKKNKEELLKNYELLFSMYQEVAISNFCLGMDLTSVSDRERKNKAENAFIHQFVDVQRMLEDLLNLR